MKPLETARLTLRVCTAEQLLALIEQPEQVDRLVGLPVAVEMHSMYGSGAVSPRWIAALREAQGSGAAPDPWRHGFFVVHTADRRVIGGAGYKGAPDADGMVEIAYGVVPPYEGKGYATEAAAALVAYAFTQESVRLVRAHTLPEPNASTHVLRKNGFRFVGDVIDPEDGPVWRWERTR